MALVPLNKSSRLKEFIVCPRMDANSTLVADDFARPNGLAFSRDERNLYIDDSKRRHIRVFTVEADGSLSGGAVFHDMNVKYERIAGRDES